MTDYRIYDLDGVDKVASADWIDADDDETAIKKAQQKLSGKGGELWSGGRLVSRIARAPRP